MRVHREALLAAGSLLLLVGGLAVAEWRSRLAETIPRPYRYSEIYGWSLRPSFSGELEGARMSVNDRGHRGRPVPLQRTPGVSRILMLGDSVAFGLGVGDQQTFAHLLDQPQRGAEVVNLAVPGYGPAQHLIQLEQEALAYDPDVVVVHLCLANDFADAMLPVSLYDERQPTPYFAVEGGTLHKVDHHLRLSPARRLLQRLAESSALYRRLASAPPEPPRSGGARWARRKKKALRDTQRAIQTSQLLLSRMNDLVRARDRRFLLVLHPDRQAFEETGEWLASLRRFAASARIQALDLAEHYRSQGLRFDDVALDGLGHLTPAGHAAAARAIETVLSRRP